MLMTNLSIQYNLYNTRLNKAPVFVSLDVEGKFWFTSDLCQNLRFKEKKALELVGSTPLTFNLFTGTWSCYVA